MDVHDRIAELTADLFARPPEEGVSLAVAAMVDGKLVHDRYGADTHADTTLISWSMAKSMVHAAIGILVLDGRLDVDAPAPVPAWARTDKERITVLDLLEMRSGLRFVEDYVDGDVSHCLAMLFGEGVDDHAGYAADLPLDHEPGAVWNYSSGNSNILARIIGDVVGDVAGDRGGDDAGDRGGDRGEGVAQFLRDRLFDPCGMTSATPKFDTAGTWVGSSYVYATARDFARFGELYRRDGVTPDGRRILPEGWAEHGRTFVAHDPTDDLRDGLDYGRHWWMWPQFPGSMAAHGFEGQYTVVVPDRRLTLVHLGKTPAHARRNLFDALVRIVRAVPRVAEV